MEKSKYIICIVFFLILSSNKLKADTGDGSLSDTNIEYIGRWDKSDKKKYHSYWGGAYFRVSFTGKAVKLKLSGSVNIYIDMDDQGPVKYKNVDGIVNITANPLKDGIHNLLVAANYAGDEIKFQGLILELGSQTIPQPNKDIMEFIGNSITTGQKTTKGNLTAYPWLTGEFFECDHTQISHPGITLVDGYSYDGNWAPLRGQSVQYFLLKQPNQELNQAWDFNIYTPKVIVINLGTNDHNLEVPKTIFQSVYFTFLKDIRDKYADAEIFVMRTFAGYYEQETKNVVNQRIRANDTKIHYIDTSNWLLVPEDYTDGTHPNDAGHLKVAKNLLPILQPYFK